MDKHDHNHSRQYDVVGQMAVTGNGSLSIPLARDAREVAVRFVGHSKLTPCNINKEDVLEFHIRREVVRHRSQLALDISWSVFDIREIEWEIVYC
jgi:hypothetical protein